MESCYECPYRKKSAADLRIGDYWGRKFANEKYGISMVIANDEKGEAAIRMLKQAGTCGVQEYSLDDYWSIQNTTNSAKVLIREQLLSELQDPSQDIHTLRNKYCRYYDWEERVLAIMAATRILK